MRTEKEIEKEINKLTKRKNENAITNKEFLTLQKELIEEALKLKGLKRNKRSKLKQALFIINNALKMLGAVKHWEEQK